MGKKNASKRKPEYDFPSKFLLQCRTVLKFSRKGVQADSSSD